MAERRPRIGTKCTHWKSAAFSRRTRSAVIADHELGRRSRGKPSHARRSRPDGRCDPRLRQRQSSVRLPRTNRNALNSGHSQTRLANESNRTENQSGVSADGSAPQSIGQVARYESGRQPVVVHSRVGCEERRAETRSIAAIVVADRLGYGRLTGSNRSRLRLSGPCRTRGRARDISATRRRESLPVGRRASLSRRCRPTRCRAPPSAQAE